MDDVTHTVRGDAERALHDASAREELVARVRAMTPHLDAGDTELSPYHGGRAAADARLQGIDPVRYGKTRNHLDGAVTRLSPYIRHGVVSLAAMRDRVVSGVDSRREAEKLVQQLTWRDYWRRLYADLGERVWDDIEPYKTGFDAGAYADELPDDIAAAETDSAAINHFLRELFETGWLHNHARLYVAGYVCHFRRVKWQAGARLFLSHLVDGDPAANNLSWQWCASTFSHKPYFFNLENVQTFCGPDVDTRYTTNKVLAGTYDDIHARLFPLLPPQDSSGRTQNGKRRHEKKRRHKRAHHPQ